MFELARTGGLNAVDSEVASVAVRDLLLVRRSDRDVADGGYRRHRMVSALTLLRTDCVSGRKGGLAAAYQTQHDPSTTLILQGFLGKKQDKLITALRNKLIFD